MPKVSRDHVRFQFGGDVTIETLSDALTRFSQVLDALRETHSAEVSWKLIGLDYGSVAATAQAAPLDDEAQSQIPAMYDSLIHAAESVKNGHADRGFSLHEQMHKLMALADESHPVTIQTNGNRVVVEAPLAPLRLSAADWQEEDPVSLGTVRGRVETLSRRRGLSFNLYELATNTAVTCYLDKALEDTMRDVRGHIADVTGAIKRDSRTDRPLWIRRVTNVDPVDEGEPDGYLMARGALQTSEPSEVLVRRIRDEE